MSRRKTLLDEFFDILEPLMILYVVAMIAWWFTNKAAFWKWFFYGIGFVAIIIAIGIWRRKTRFKHVQGFLSDRELLLKLRRMHPTEFEEYIADLFSRLGYKTEVTGGSYDQGVDVVAEKGGVKHYIQCKKFITSVVTPGDVRDFYGATADHLAVGKGYFITTNKFTLEAERFADDKPIELIDGQKLIKYIRLAEKENSAKKSQLVEPVIRNPEKCSECGGDLVEKEGRFGKFYGCSNYPKCHFTKK